MILTDIKLINFRNYDNLDFLYANNKNAWFSTSKGELNVKRNFKFFIKRIWTKKIISRIRLRKKKKYVISASS